MIEFELRKIKYFDAMSEETPCFTTEIWEDGKLVAYAKNDGHGGGNQIDHVHNVNTYKDIAKFDNMDVEAEIFRRVWENDDVKKRQGKGIILVKDERMSIVKFPMAISKFKKHSKYTSWIDDVVTKYSDYKVMNTNL